MRAGSAAGRRCSARNFESAPGNRQWRSAHGARDALAEDEPFEQRIAGKPVSAMQTGRRDLAAGPEAGHRGRAVGARGNAAHVEMRGRRDR